MKKKYNKVISIIALIISAYFANNYVQENKKTTTYQKETQYKSTSNKQLEALIKKRQSNVIITLDVRVINVLSDDNQGDRHQRLIVKSGKHTLLLAHNIDIAPRVPVKKGDMLKVRGEYEWNDKGGVVHWTHRSTSSHADGWIIHNNKKYH
jgi:hypothetical protein